MPDSFFKCLGTLAPTIQFYEQTGSDLVLALGIGNIVYDVVYRGTLRILAILLCRTLGGACVSEVTIKMFILSRFVRGSSKYGTV
jgi:hypothetical protein